MRQPLSLPLRLTVLMRPAYAELQAKLEAEFATWSARPELVPDPAASASEPAASRCAADLNALRAQIIETVNSHQVSDPTLAPVSPTVSVLLAKLCVLKAPIAVSLVCVTPSLALQEV